MKVKVKPKSIFPTVEPKQKTGQPNPDDPFDPFEPLVQEKKNDLKPKRVYKQSIISKISNIIKGDIMKFFNLKSKELSE